MYRARRDQRADAEVRESIGLDWYNIKTHARARLSGKGFGWPRCRHRSARAQVYVAAQARTGGDGGGLSGNRRHHRSRGGDQIPAHQHPGGSAGGDRCVIRTGISRIVRAGASARGGCSGLWTGGRHALLHDGAPRWGRPVGAVAHAPSARVQRASRCLFGPGALALAASGVSRPERSERSVYCLGGCQTDRLWRDGTHGPHAQGRRNDGVHGPGGAPSGGGRRTFGPLFRRCRHVLRADGPATQPGPHSRRARGEPAVAPGSGVRGRRNEGPGRALRAAR